MTRLGGKLAVVTGAAAGIGQALCQELARAGCDVAVVDVDQAGLDQTRGLVCDAGATVSLHKVDVSNRDQVFALPAQVLAEHGRADMLINNAGVSLRATLDSVKREDFEWLLGINLFGPVLATQAFLPHLLRQPEGHVVNVSSVHGLFTSPGTGPYCTSKFALRGYTLALAQELRHTSVRVSCVLPGGVRTNLARKARYAETHNHGENRIDFMAVNSPQYTARVILRGVRKNKERILVGPDAHLYDLASRTFPTTWQRLVGAVQQWGKR